MKTLRPIIASALLAAALPVCAEMEAAPAALGEAVLVEKTATVEAVDPASRYVTLKGPEGGLVTVQAGPKVKNLDKVKKGDQVTVKYYQAMAVDVVAPGTEGGTVTKRAAAEPGMAPAGAVARQTSKTVKILSVDKYKKAIAFRDEKGNWREVLLDRPELKHYLDDLKEGDTVEVTFTEAVAVSVETR
jgi:FtsP/CotA-like multicopper oxidase with cupredoxin domain